MKKVYRKMMLFSAAVVFLATAPLVVLYAMGYRLGSSNIDPLPVGVLFIETVPRRSQLAINGEVSGDTPRAVSNLPPGTVRATVTREGYKTWEKNLPIEPTLVTEARDVRLFPEKPVVTSLLPNARLFAVSPNHRLIAIVTADRFLHFLDEEGRPVSSAIRLSSLPIDAQWSPDNASLLLQLRGNQWLFVTVATETPELHSLPAVSGATSVIWDPRIAGRLLIVSNRKELRSYNVLNNTSSLLASRVDTLATSSRHIFLGQAGSGIEVLTLQGDTVQTIALPASATLKKLLVTAEGRVAYIDSTNTVFVLSESGQAQEVAKNVQHADWSPDGHLLLLQTADNELHVSNPTADRVGTLASSETQLIVRLSRPITDPQWFAGSRHLLYQVNDELHITEIDTRDFPITYIVDSTNTGTAEVVVGMDGAKLFYLKRTGTTTSLTSAKLAL